jgi:hypothetical protein
VLENCPPNEVLLVCSLPLLLLSEPSRGAHAVGRDQSCYTIMCMWACLIEIRQTFLAVCAATILPIEGDSGGGLFRLYVMGSKPEPECCRRNDGRLTGFSASAQFVLFTRVCYECVQELKKVFVR